MAWKDWLLLHHCTLLTGHIRGDLLAAHRRRDGSTYCPTSWVLYVTEIIEVEKQGEILVAGEIPSSV